MKTAGSFELFRFTELPTSNRKISIPFCDSGFAFRAVDVFGKRFDRLRIVFLNSAIELAEHYAAMIHKSACIPEFVLGVLETFGHEIYGLVLLVLVRLHGRQGRFERPEFGFAGHGVQEFAVSGQQPGAVRLHLAVFLTQTEFDREPVHLYA